MQAVRSCHRGFRGICAHTKFFNFRPHVIIQRHHREFSVPLRSFSFSHQCRLLSTISEANTATSTQHEFKAEIRKLLDIVAQSLYSDKEVFLRELISNASDSIQRWRIQQINLEDCSSTDSEAPQITLIPDRQANTLTIIDNGMGMCREELIENLGTIAHSGAKQFVDEFTKSGSEMASKQELSSIIGKFGVGFYSTFMVANKIEVFSRKRDLDSPGLRWICDGSTKYDLTSCTEDVDYGTRIVLHLKKDCTHYSQEEVIKEIILKYSNFVGFPIILMGEQINKMKPLWLEDPKSVSQEDYVDFYRYVSKCSPNDEPRYVMHYCAEAPLSMRALLYVPAGKPSVADLMMDNGDNHNSSGISLYKRKVLITPHADTLLPRWLRFMKGVIDSEDLPLNLSREMLQDHQLIRRLRLILTKRILKYFNDESKKNVEKFNRFYRDFNLSFKEALARSTDQREKEDIAEMLRFESSKLEEGRLSSLRDYISRTKPGQRHIYYIASPTYQMAITSPYFEAFKARDEECLFLLESHDEIVIIQLAEFGGKKLRSIEEEMESAKNVDDNILTRKVYQMKKRKTSKLGSLNISVTRSNL